MTSLPQLKDLRRCVDGAAQTKREDLRRALQQKSIAALAGLQLDPFIDAAFVAFGELAALILELERATLDEQRPAWSRLGALSALFYGAAPMDAMSDASLGGVGLLDDWLVLMSARIVYIRAADANESLAIAEQSQRVSCCLPPDVVLKLLPLVGGMETSRQLLQSIPPAEVLAEVQASIRSPAPFVISLPDPPQPQPYRDPAGGWTHNSSGSTWSDGRAMQFRFNDGSSVGVTSSGKIAGGPG